MFYLKAFHNKTKKHTTVLIVLIKTLIIIAFCQYVKSIEYTIWKQFGKDWLLFWKNKQ